ncbi:(6-4)-photolyase(1) [Ephemera danica]|nr:(6-4)-photolyase(1) [Ephemera danica]
MSSSGTVIHWFRKGLRLHDNPALLSAIEKIDDKCFELRPIFILDPWIVTKLRVGTNRWRFLQQSLQDLDSKLRAIGSRLYVLRGKPENVFPKIFKDWKVKRLTFELDTEPYARERDARIEKLAKEAGVPVAQKVSHTLYDTERVIMTNMGKPPLTYQKMVSLAEQMGRPLLPKSAPESLPDECKVGAAGLPVNETDWPNTDVPSLEELGVDPAKLQPCLYPGGETEALRRMEEHLAKKAWICKFEKPETSPNSLKPSTTVLSPYIKFGCLSARTFYHGSAHSKPPVSLVGQMLWREFFYTVSAATPNFDRMQGNPICCQIPWGSNPTHLKAWTEGQTGFPFIDAVMRQLRQEGWIHHLARHSVACFLTRGDLWISWEEGMKVFEEFLLDADWALNAGNWMWLSASAFFHQYFRVYSPIAFGKKTDKDGSFIRKYVPELAKYPAEYIYEPWKSSLSVQRAAGCIIGQDYPRPIVNHDEASKRNKSRMAEAYKKNKQNKTDEGSSNAKKRGAGNDRGFAKKFKQ